MSTVGNLLQRLLPSVSGPIGSLPIPPDMLRNFLRAQPAYNEQRERAAVVLDQGFAAYDAWQGIKPTLFVGGLIGMAASAYAMHKRKGRGHETWVLYGATFLASAAAAWVARPGTSPTAPPGVDGADGFNVVSAIDARRAKLKAQNPAFADQVFNRLAALPGVQGPLDANPIVKAAIV